MNRRGRAIDWTTDLPSGVSGRMNSLPGRFFNWLSDLLLVVMTLVILLVAAYVFVAAFRDLDYAELRIAQSLDELGVLLGGTTSGATGQGTLTPQARAFLERLEAYSASGLESSTISFLAIVFGFAIVTASIQLLSRAQRELRTAHDHRVEALRFVDDALTSPAILSQLIRVNQATTGLVQYRSKARWVPPERKQQDAKWTETTARVRDQLQVLYSVLDQGTEEMLGIEPLHFAYCLDLMGEVGVGLHAADVPQELPEIWAIYDNCKRLLAPEFVVRYKEKRDKLLGKGYGLT